MQNLPHPHQSLAKKSRLRWVWVYVWCLNCLKWTTSHKMTKARISCNFYLSFYIIYTEKKKKKKPKLSFERKFREKQGKRRNFWRKWEKVKSKQIAGKLAGGHPAIKRQGGPKREEGTGMQPNQQRSKQKRGNPLRSSSRESMRTKYYINEKHHWIGLR